MDILLIFMQQNRRYNSPPHIGLKANGLFESLSAFHQNFELSFDIHPHRLLLSNIKDEEANLERHGLPVTYTVLRQAEDLLCRPDVEPVILQGRAIGDAMVEPEYHSALPHEGL